jgi:putative ABC transport system ATP-binding protein
VVKSYGRDETLVRAVDGIDLEVHRGEFIVVAGPSGSGKSTLLQLLGALDRPTAGAIHFEDRNLAERGDAELAALRLNTLGFVFQQFNLIPTLTARENVEIALAPASLDPAARGRRARELLERVGLAERAEHLPSQLSGGEQQRVAIARALANEPEVLLADEPTGAVDSATGEEIGALLTGLSAAGQTLILVTHNPDLAERYAHRVVALTDGRLASDTTVVPR